MKILPTQVLPALLALAFLVLAPSYAHAQDATSSEDTREDIFITCVKGKGSGAKLVNISDCNSLDGRLQAGFQCSGAGMMQCGLDDDLTCKQLGGSCVSPQGGKCAGFLNGDCQPPCKCSVGGGGGGGGRCDQELAALDKCRFMSPGTLSCKDAPFDENSLDRCLTAVIAVNDCCHGGGGGGSKCESDGTKCGLRLCKDPDEVSICIDFESVCCDPTSPGGGGGGGRSCDPNQHIICNSNELCPAGTMMHRCDPGDGPNCMGGITYQCVETGGGGGNCDPPDLCAVCGRDTPVCVDCDNDGCCESCTSP